MATKVLNSGAKIPLVGLGTWKSKPGQVKTAVVAALQCGYRHIDCATIYQNQQEIGEALQECFASGVVKREEVFITSKLWNNRQDRDDVIPALKQTLEELRLDYLDLYLIHWPVRFRRDHPIGTRLQKEDLIEPNIPETWQAFEEAVRLGLTKSIGVSNFSQKKLQALLNVAKIPPAINQVEVHPLFRQDALIEFCASKGIHVTAYSPLGSPDRPSKTEQDPTLLEHPTVLEIAQRMGKTPAQILIRWAIQHGTSVIPKSVTPDRIKSNLDVFAWQLSDQDYHMLSTLPNQQRMILGTYFVGGVGGPQTTAELWDEVQ
eukprot:TRINITY_DN9483_c0_g1::TRINITY_DN9483_c0_g1_i1::g.265::m.265 TRINITY_DN9483_c0_g1::TRINITY_DN9483_c0_g1_i1::g.265  ORF type:complete len:333 (+),score=65.65,sp/Q84TF0/AKRCA_ARATH/49.84/5e-102,Aldo_ket_red/PF00248.16/3.3e-59,Sigma70_r4/PF04545.11/5.4e+02,Sigma70_r4/PF04545.11/1.4e+02,Sigma70_r4/PF04545.11/6.2 TRINITY_DN9483_c0_g1_i1:46-999(+)